MDRSFVQQMIVFAAIFLILQVGLDLAQGVPLSPGVFLSRLITTAIATGLYGALTLWLKKRRQRKD